MMILIGLALLIVVGVILKKKLSWGYDYIGGLIYTFALLSLSVTLFFWPVVYYSYMAEIEQYHALQDTIEYSRENNMSELERATILRDIAEFNQSLASTKYWNETIFGIYIPDEITELEPIR